MKKWLFRHACRIAAGLALACLAAATPAQAAAIQLTVDTSALIGMNGRIEFSLFDGDGVANNTAAISNLNTDGTFGMVDCSVGCSGGPPYVVDDSLGFGSFLQNLVLGSTFSFFVTYTNNFAGGLPDQFAVFLLDQQTSFTLIDTSLDSPFGDALALVTLDGTTNIQTADAGVSVSAIPEPGTAALLSLFLPLLLLRKRSARTTR
jgi:hypothetical protein